MKYVSLFSGIEAATVAWEPNVGDVTKMNWKKYRNEVDQGSCSSTFERYVKYVLDGFFGKTSQERSQARMGRLSDDPCPK